MKAYTIQQIEAAINWWRSHGADGRPDADAPDGVYLCAEVAQLAKPYGALIAMGKTEIAEGPFLSPACVDLIEKALPHVSGDIVD